MNSISKIEIEAVMDGVVSDRTPGEPKTAEVGFQTYGFRKPLQFGSHPLCSTNSLAAMPHSGIPNPRNQREAALDSGDERFMRLTMKVVEKNLAERGFDVQALAHGVMVSRRQLFRKFKALLDCTPNVFIRNMRLKRAAELLSESQLSILDVTFAVGFSDPKYFRTVFRRHFGMLPSRYAKHVVH